MLHQPKKVRQATQLIQSKPSTALEAHTSTRSSNTSFRYRLYFQGRSRLMHWVSPDRLQVGTHFKTQFGLFSLRLITVRSPRRVKVLLNIPDDISPSLEGGRAKAHSIQSG